MGLVGCKGSYAQRGVESEGGGGRREGKRDGKRDGFGCGKREVQRQAHGTPPFLNARRDGYVVSSLVFFFWLALRFLLPHQRWNRVCFAPVVKETIG